MGKDGNEIYLHVCNVHVVYVVSYLSVITVPRPGEDAEAHGVHKSRDILQQNIVLSRYSSIMSASIFQE